MKTIYCLGFAFSEDGSHVALIRKARPAWQAGKLNGIGGHVERREHPQTAMAREFKEETGYDTWSIDWDAFAKMKLPDAEVYCYRTFRVDLTSLETKTDEEVVVTTVEVVRSTLCIPNLSWLVPLALDREVLLTIIRYEKDR